MEKETLILGIENPLLDISSNVDADIYKRYDLPLDATVLAEEKHLPLFKELKEKYNPTYIPGGSTQNTLRAAQVVFYTTAVVALKSEAGVRMLLHWKRR